MAIHNTHCLSKELLEDYNRSDSESISSFTNDGDCLCNEGTDDEYIYDEDNDSISDEDNDLILECEEDDIVKNNSDYGSRSINVGNLKNGTFRKMCML
jgi:hypothetical protein